MSHKVVDTQEVMYILYLMVVQYRVLRDSSGDELSTPLLVIQLCKFKSQVWAILLRSQVHKIEFSPSVVATKSRQNDNRVGKELVERSIKE